MGDKTLLHVTKYVLHESKDYVLPHKHGCYEIVYYLSGNGRTSIKDNNYNYEEDTLVIIPPDTVHDEQTIVKGEVLCCQFEPIIDFQFEEKVFKKNKNTEKALGEIKAKILDIHALFKADKQDEAGKVLWELNFLLYRLYEKKVISKDSYIDTIFENTKKYLEKNFQYKINYEVLAESTGYSYDRFRHAFKENVGVTINDYKNMVRMTNAKKLIVETDLKIIEISAKCGFKNNIRFSMWFKKLMNITPMDYRKIIRKGRYDGVYNPEVKT